MENLPDLDIKTKPKIVYKKKIEKAKKDLKKTKYIDGLFTKDYLNNYFKN